MAIYELEDRIYFDGGLPADIAEVQEDTSEQEVENSDTAENNSGTGDSDNTENVSIAPESPSSEEPGDNADNDSGKSSDDSSDSADSNSQTDGLTDSQPDSIAAVLDAIDDTTITNDFFDNQNFLIISADNENFEEIADSLNDKTTLIIYDSDDTFDSIIQQLKDELGDNKAVNIGILDSDGDQPALRSSDEVGLSVISEQLTNNQQLTTDNQISDFLDDLKDLQYFDGEINLIEFSSNDQQEVTSSIINFTHHSLGEGGQQLEIINDDDSLTDYFLEDSDFLTTDNQQQSTNNEIVFINSSVMNSEEIVDDLSENAEVVYLTSGEDGIQQISDYLADKTDIDTIRIISHGNEGYFVLNGQIIDSDYLTENGEVIASWSNSLSENADIMLYGCNLAATDDGKAFVDSFADLTGADVAAATFNTGGAEANWSLNYNVGEIEAVQLSIDGYDYHLASHTVTSNADDGANTLRYWIDNASSGDEIVFNLSAGNETITLAEMLEIDKSLTIDGDNENGSGTDVTVQANANPDTANYEVFKILNFSTEISVTLEKLTIQNGKTSMEGGGIWNCGETLTIRDCTIKNNAAENGGGIANFSGGTITLEGTNTFTGNNASEKGGGIYNESGSITLNGTNTFTGNEAYATVYGQAIQIDSGAFFSLGEGSVLNMAEGTPLYAADGLNFSGSNSTVVFNGGSKQVINCDITFDNLELTTGTVLSDLSTARTITVSGETSGAGTVEVDEAGSTFTYSGGDQTVYSGSYGTLSFSGSTTGSTKTFADGTTTVANQISLTDTITLTASSDDNVTVQANGSNRVIYVNASGKTVTIENMTLQGKGSSVALNGAVLNVNAGTVNISNSTIKNGISTLSGGGIYNAVDGTLSLSSCTVTGNNGPSGGGGIFNDGTISSISNSTISSNTTANYGGGINNQGTITSISNSTISGNNSDESGGGIYNNLDAATTNIQNCTITGNTATNNEGGAIYNTAGTINIINSTICDNTAGGSFHAAIFDSGTIYILNSIIINNSNMDLKNNSATMNVYYSWYKNSFGTIGGSNNNSANYTAGDLGSLTYNGGFTNTSAVSAAGNDDAKAGSGTYAYYNSTDGYYFYNGSNYTKISDGSTFTPSSPSTDQITIDQRGYYRNTYDTRTVTRGAYQYNAVVAKIGDDTSWTTGSATYTSIDAAYNAASTSDIIELPGTAIYEYGISLDEAKTVTIRRDDDISTTTYVQAAATAGTASDRVFNITAGTVTLEDMTIRYGNSADAGGGISIIFASTNVVNIKNVNVSENSADAGGGIYIAPTSMGTTVNIINSTINENTATGTIGGGGIYSNDVGGDRITLNISNSTISGNSTSNSSAKGGGIFNNASTINLKNSTIAENSAGSLGGGIYNDVDGVLWVRNTILANNTASDSPNDYYYLGGRLFDNGYNVVEYQNLAATSGNDFKAFNNTNDILYNTVAGDPTIEHFVWNQSGSNLDNQTLGLSSTLALNDSTNGTYTLALAEGSFAAASESGNGIPSDSNWNNSPEIDGAYTDQRGVERTSGQYTSIGAYSANYEPTVLYYMAKVSGNWSAYGTVWFTSTTVDGPYNTQATEAPTADNSGGIIINDDIDVTVVTGGFSIDQVTVDTGASIIINNGQTVTLANGTDDDLTVAGTGALDVNGTLDAGAAQIVFSGAGALNLVQTSFSVNSFTAGTSTVTLDGGVAQTIGSDITFNNLTLSTSTVLTTSNNITVSGETSGTGTVNASSGTFTYNRSGDQNIFSGTYNAITLSGSGTKTFTGTNTVSGGVTIDSSLTVSGSTSTASDTVVQVNASSGAGEHRVFLIAENSLTVTIQDITVKNGVDKDSDSYHGGAGILAYGNYITLNLDNIDLNNNIVTTGESTGDEPYGAGLLIEGDYFNVTITDSSIHDNINYIDHGGGIAFVRTNGAAEDTSLFNITNTSIYDNSIQTYSSGYGGGIYTEYINSSATSTISNSTIYDNTATSVGGGISVHDINLNVNNSTISENTSNGYGGGMRSSSSTVSLNSVTIANNQSDNDNSGGGYYLNSGNLTVQNSIIANNNSGSTPVRNDFYYNSGSITDNGYNIVGISSNYSWTEASDWTLNGTSGDTYNNVGGSPSGTLNLSSTLADNGGPTLTLAIESSSSIAVGNGSTSEITDQRGVTRQDSPTIGAYEYYASQYRTKSGGGTDWSVAANWEVNNAGGGEDFWIAATESPDADNSDSINVRRDMNVNASVAIDQTIVDAAATLTVDANKTLTVSNGTDDIDLTATGNISVATDGILIINSGAVVDSNGTFRSTGTVSFNAVSGDDNGSLSLTDTTATFGTFVAAYSTVTYDGSSEQSIQASTVYYNLILSGSAAKTTSDSITVSGNFEASQNLTISGTNKSLTVGGTSEIGAVISTSGSQSYTGNVTLTADSQFSATSGNITFDQTIDGTRALALTAGSGNISFGAAVGSSNPLGAVTVNAAAEITASSTFSCAGFNQAVTGTGTVQFVGLLTSTGTVIIDATTIDLDGGITTTGGLVDLNASTEINLAVGKNITTTAGVGVVSGAVDIDTTGDGTVTLAGNIVTSGNTQAAGGNIDINTENGAINIASLTSTGGAGSAPGKAGGAITLVGTDIVVSGTINSTGGAGTGYDLAGGAGGAVSITASGTADISTVITAGGGGADITAYGGTGGIIGITSTNGLTVGTLTASGGDSKGSGGRGGGAGGAITLSGGDVVLTGIITSTGGYAAGGYNGGAGGAVSITATDESPLITLGNNINTRGGSTQRGDNYGTGGNILFNDNVKLNTDITLTTGSDNATQNGGNVTFDGAVTGTDTDNLTVYAGIKSGTIWFKDTVGAGGQIANLEVTGTTNIKVDNDITTSGTQDYNSKVTLGGDVTFDADDNAITFDSTVKGETSARTLSVNSGTSKTTFTGAVGGSNLIDSVTVTADDIDIGAAFKAQNDITLQTSTSGTVISLGSGSGLLLTATELGYLDSGSDSDDVTTIGSASGGSIIVGADSALSNVTNLHLKTGSTITGTVGGIAVTNLSMTAGDEINFTSAYTAVTVLAVSNSGNDVTFTESDGFTSGAVDGITGITGTNVTLSSSGNTITVNNTAADDDINTSGNLSITAGTLTNNGTIATEGAFTASGFTSVGGTFKYDGGNQSVAALTYNNLTLSGSGTKTALGDISVTGNWANSVTFNGTDNSTTVTFSGSDTQTISGTNNFYNLTISNTHASNYVDASSSTLSVSNLLNITDGKLKSASDYHDVTIGTDGTLELTGDITVSGSWSNSGAFTHADHGVTFDGSEDSETISGTNIFYDLTIDKDAVTDTVTLASGTLDVNSNLTITKGVLSTENLDVEGTTSFGASAGDGTLVITGSGGTGNISFGILSEGVGTIKYSSNSAQEIIGETYYDLIFDGSGDKTLVGNISIGNAFTVTEGTFVNNGNTVTYSGIDQTVLNNTDLGGVGYAGLTLSGSGTKSLSGNTTVSSDLTVNSGTTLQGGHTLTVGGDAVFNGAVGSSTALTSLEVTGTSTIGADISTTGIQTYTEAVTVSEDVSVDSETGDLTFDDIIIAYEKTFTVGDGTSGAVNFTGTVSAESRGGDLNFTWSQIATVDGGVNSIGVTSSDLDGDGDNDLIFANYGETNSIGINDGSGNFTWSQIATVDGGNNSEGVTSSDLDGDGDNDLIFANNGGTNSIGINDGSGNFTWRQIATEDGGHYSFGVTSSDLDGDGDNDLIFANYGANSIGINDGSGNFTWSQTTGDGEGDSRGVTSSDLDKDGDNDLIFANYGGTNSIGINDGTGNFTWSQIATVDGGVNSIGVTSSDLDGDGDNDLIFGNYSGTNSIGINDGSGNFTWSQIEKGDGGINSLGVTSSDLDGDGDNDLIFANFFGTNSIGINDGTGNFTWSQIAEGDGGRVSQGVTSSNLDGDGDNDLIFANSGTNSIGINESTPVGSSGNLIINTASSVTATSIDLGEGTLTLTDTGGFSVSGAVTASEAVLTNTSGAVTFNGALTVDTLTTALEDYSVALNSGGTITEAVTFSNSGGVTLDGGVTFNGGIISTLSTTTLAGDVTSSNDAVEFGTVSVSDDSTVDTAGGALTFGAVTISSTKTLTAGTGNTGAIEFGTVDGPGLLTVYTDNTATFTGAAGSTAELGGFTLTDGTVELGTNDFKSASLTVNGGIFNNTVGSESDWDINGNVNIGSSGSLNATEGTFTVSGNWSNSGTFTSGSNTVTFDGGSTSTLTSGGTGSNYDFSTLAVTNGTTLQAVTNDIKAANVNVTSGTLDMATNDLGLEVTGTLTVSASQNYYTGTGQQTIGTLTNNGNVTIEGDKDNVTITTMTNNDGSLWTYTKSSGTVKVIEGTYHDLTFNDGGDTADYTLQAATNVSGALTVTGGTVSLNTYKLDVTETVTNNDTIAIGTGELEVTGNITNNATITVSTGTLDADGDLDVGTLTASGAASIEVAGNWSGVDAFTSSTSTVTFDGGSTSTLTSGGTGADYDFSTITISNGTTLQPVTNDVKATSVNVTSGTLDMAANDVGLEVTGTLTVSASQNYYTGTGQQTIGTLTNNGNVTIEGDKDNVSITTMTNNDGSLWTYTKSSGTVRVIEGTYHDLTFNDGGGTANYTLQAATNVSGALTVTGGTVSLNTYKLDVTETVTNNDTIAIGTGELEVTGNITNNATITVSTGTLDADGDLDVGTLTASGAASIEVAGDWSGVDTFTADNSTVLFNGSSSQSVTSGGSSFYALDIDNSLSLQDALVATDTVDLASSKTITTANSVTFSGATSGTGTVTASGGTFTYNRDGDQTVFNGTYSAMTLSGSGTKSFSGTTTATGGITVSGSLTADGDGASTTIVQAAVSEGTGSSRVFTVESDNIVIISDMTVRYGKSSSHGGGISNSGTLILNNMTVSYNLAQNNTSSTELKGGGIYNTGVLTVNNSTISNNTVDKGYSGSTDITAYALGGGIFNNNSIEINNSTVFGNSAIIANYRTNSTSRGGGVYSEGTSTTTINNCTVSGNAVTATGSGTLTAQGAGLTVADGNATIKNSILAQNTNNDTNYDYYYCGGTLTDNGYNIAEYQGFAISWTDTSSFDQATDYLFNYNKSGTEISSPSSWNKNDVNVTGSLNLSSTLANNGGYTETLAITSVSSIAVGNGSTTEKFDQRGYYRGLSGGITIGAYEYDGTAPVNGDYISVADGNWSATAVWETYDSSTGEWSAAESAPDSGDNVIIAFDDTVTVDGAKKATELTVAYGGELTVGTESITVTEDITIAGTLAVSSGTVTLGGDWNSSTGTFTADHSTVIFNGSSMQSITSGNNSFYNVIVNNDSIGVKIFDNTTISNNLILTDEKGLFDTNGYTLTVNGSIQDNSGGEDFNADHMIIVNGTGKLHLPVAPNTSYLFPVGTYSEDKGYVYSPITIEFANGDFSGDDYVEVTAAPDKFAENPCEINYLSRYWNATSSGVVNYNATVTCYYDRNDVVGTESDTFGAEYLNSSWIKTTAVDANNHNFTLTAVTSLAVFTGIAAPYTASVVLTPSTPQTITAGNTRLFSAAAYDQYGNLITDTATDFTWTNTTSAGLFNSTTADSYTINAVYESVSSENVSVTVQPGEVDTVSISPSEAQTLNSGETVQFSASAYDLYENLISDTATNFTWTNTTNTGLFNTAAAGAYSVKAVYDGVSSVNVSVTVNARPNPTRPDVNNREMINDGTETQTHTSWRTSIDSDIGIEDNYYFEVENDDLFNDAFTSTTAAISSLSNGEYGLTNTGASSSSSGISIGGFISINGAIDGEYGVGRSVSSINGATDGEYGVGHSGLENVYAYNSTSTERFNGEYGVGSSSGTNHEVASRYDGFLDLSFDFEEGSINYDAIAAYNERHPLFKTELDNILDKV